MANLGSLSALITAIDAAITTNGANEITGAILNGILQDVADTLTGVGVQPKVYKAILNQTGTAAPVATVLVNTLGGTVVWTRNNPGDYTGTLATAFPIAKTLITSTTYTDPSADAAVMVISGGDGDTISCYMFDSGAPADNVASYTAVIIEVYP
jgi:hypothetical protein